MHSSSDMSRHSKARAVNKAGTLVVVTLTGIIIAALFSLITFGLNYVALTKAIILGTLISFVSGYFELFVFPQMTKNKKFVSILTVKTLFYVLVISIPTILLWIIHESMVNSAGFFETLGGDDFRRFILTGDFRIILIFSFVAGFILNLFAQISSLIGRKVFLNYLTGKYNKPKEEERTFMFLDLTSSTAIAEKLGSIAYHRFMNSCFYDIDGPIVETKGEIYQYVGDEVIISWIGERAFKNNNCIECFFRIKQVLAELREKYQIEFGMVPKFKGGIHTGAVVAGEIGDSKKEIVFHGDVLNTASRIQAKCKEMDTDLLISEDVKTRLSEESDYNIEELGEFALKGKSQKLRLFGVSLIS